MNRATGSTRRRVAWAALILAQLAVPAAQIARSEGVLRRGERVMLACRPVDPADPLRGRYVDLAFDPADAPPGFGADDCARRARIYVPLEPGDGGVARFGRATTERPESGPYLTARCARRRADGRIDLDLPFRRFFVEEGLAPEAERAYRARASTPSTAVRAALRVRKGVAVPEELYFDGVPLREALSGPAAARSPSTSSDRDSSN